MPLRLPWGITAWLVRAFATGSAAVSAGLHSVAKHTGIPIVVVAAAALVLSFRLVRRGGRLALEMAFALALVLVATKLGWIHW